MRAEQRPSTVGFTATIMGLEEEWWEATDWSYRRRSDASDTIMVGVAGCGGRGGRGGRRKSVLVKGGKFES